MLQRDVVGREEGATGVEETGDGGGGDRPGWNQRWPGRGRSGGAGTKLATEGGAGPVGSSRRRRGSTGGNRGRDGEVGGGRKEEDVGNPAWRRRWEVVPRAGSPRRSRGGEGGQEKLGATQGGEGGVAATGWGEKGRAQGKGG